MKAISILGLVLTLTAAGHAQQDPLGAAKDLYESASYEEALSTLAKLGDGAAPEVARQANQYQIYCLFALGRTAAAEQIAETLIRKEPLLKLSEGDASPRIQTMFTAVRKRVLPTVIRDEYRTARTALDAKDFKGAEPHLLLVSRMLGEARDLGTMDDTLADLGLLVDGFLGLSKATAEQQAVHAAAAQVPAAPARAPQPAVPEAPTASLAAAPAASPSAPQAVVQTAAAPPAPPAAMLRPADGIYTGVADGHLALPVAISQAVPDPPSSILDMVKRSARKSVVLELVINESGAVQDVSTIEEAWPIRDWLVKVVRQWKYRPATVDGMPVKFRKSFTLTFPER